MTDRELMQRALDALEQMAKEGWLLHGPEGMDEAQTKCIQSLEALRARLAQPEQEPVAQVDYNERGNICWLFGKQVPDKTLLYTAPPQREWQGLTDEEIKAMRHMRDWTAGWTDIKYAREIEAKLKEKNA